MDKSLDEQEQQEQDDFEEVIELGDEAPPDDDETTLNDDDQADEQMMVEDVIDESIGSFAEHNEAVLCCDVSHNNQFVVTGGQDDKAFVWDPTTQIVKFEISGHKDSIVAASFNANSTLVATGDLSGFIKICDLTGKLCYDFEVDDLNWMHWHPVADNILLAGTKSGEGWMWKLSQNNPQCKTFQSYGNENMCAKIFNDGKRIVMGYEDGSLRIWDLKNGQVIGSITDKHSTTVLCLDINSDNSLIASGSVDSTVKIINVNSSKILMNIQIGASNNSEENDNSIESIAFSDKNLLAIASLNGSIEIWDVSSQTKRSELKLDYGFSKILVDKLNPNMLYCGCLDSFFRVIDLRSAEIVLTKGGHKDDILDFAISSDSKHVLTCSDDATCKIFSLIN